MMVVECGPFFFPLFFARGIGKEGGGAREEGQGEATFFCVC